MNDCLAVFQHAGLDDDTICDHLEWDRRFAAIDGFHDRQQCVAGVGNIGCWLRGRQAIAVHDETARIDHDAVKTNVE